MTTKNKRVLLEVIQDRLDGLKQTAQTEPFIALLDDKGEGHVIPEHAVIMLQQNKDALAPMVRDFGQYIEKKQDIKIVNVISIFQAYMSSMDKEDIPVDKEDIVAPSQDPHSDQKMLIKIEDENGYTLYSYKIIYDSDKEENCVVQKRRKLEMVMDTEEIIESQGRAYFDKFM